MFRRRAPRPLRPVSTASGDPDRWPDMAATLVLEKLGYASVARGHLGRSGILA